MARDYPRPLIKENAVAQRDGEVFHDIAGREGIAFPIQEAFEILLLVGNPFVTGRLFRWRWERERQHKGQQ